MQHHGRAILAWGRKVKDLSPHPRRLGNPSFSFPDKVVMNGIEISCP